ncbi:MAG: penicillin-binding transpeptidase domain-containing protein [Desulfuromonadaceae bacterium]|nr:penicillin-binding transpeptidase domain-containing protein [Desulfuromonadaceae bacterium]MDD2854799.1 penicillin-binding transpeptidase domain-containing protein [Desulfuromonadaceae bacterium]
MLLLFIAVVLVLTPLIFMMLRQTNLPDFATEKWITFFRESANESAEAAKTTRTPSRFEIASNLLETADSNGSQLSARTQDGYQHIFTIDGDMQQRVYNYLAKNRVPYGVFVAIEPSSGRILGMTAYSSIDSSWPKQSPYELYPMASLFKIITASAALEGHKITPDSVIEFRGNSYSENPKYWDISPRGRNNRMDVTFAMGKSINPVYGRVASDIAGKSSVMESVSRFGFNQELLVGTPAKPSQAAEPASSNALRLMGAGLDHDVKISPLHAAVIMSAIANEGKMMAPSLTNSVVDSNGVVKELFAPRELRRLVTPETSMSLKQMLSSTVLTGTSRKAFHDRRGRPLIDIPIAAKTGSINGTDPKGHYSWFAAFAPINNPRIALVALVINPDKWKIKASQVGEQALEEFFK